MSNFSFIANAVLDIIYPKQCSICKRSLTHKEVFFCLNCRYDLPFLDRHPSTLKEIQKIFWGRVNIEQVYTLLNYQSGNNTQAILHNIKYNNKIKMAEHMGKLMANTLPKDHQIDVIIPIPLHPKKEKKRGYNQSFHLAKGLQSEMNIPIANKAIKRIIVNRSQTLFSKYDRWDNVRRIFSINDIAFLENKHILIIDDVLTTGATLESCAHELLNNVNCKISIATLATRV